MGSLFNLLTRHPRSFSLPESLSMEKFLPFSLSAEPRGGPGDVDLRPVPSGMEAPGFTGKRRLSRRAPEAAKSENVTRPELAAPQKKEIKSSLVRGGR